MTTEHEITPALMKQIADQCRVVSHLAKALAQVHDDYAKLYDWAGKGPQDIAQIVGDRSAAFMETLGEMLNGMDAVAEEDEWTVPIFREAQRRWPQRPAPQ
jgi:hypothetical protein